MRTIDDAADLLRAALIDMETGTRPKSYTSNHLNGIGKFIQLKDRKDRAATMVQKLDAKAFDLPGTDRTFA